ncbi:MAG: sulfotransferase domain-containing protein [Actinomycetota bacterium]|nr:sulfotransferase domain-containing protein [Actinomycetota bacterium]
MSAHLRKQDDNWAKSDDLAPSTRTAARRFYRQRLRPVARDLVIAGRRLVPGERMMPEFIIIGAQRAGTTSAYSYLLEHPNVLPALAKEIGYFSLHYRTRSFEWYRAHFPLLRKGGGRISSATTGEASPNYLYHPLAAERVSSRLPEVKLIALLRDPVARAYSHYHLAIKYGFEHLPFEEALGAEAERLRAANLHESNDRQANRYFRLAYIDRGIYHKHLRRWLTLFPRSQVFVVGAERLYEDPSGTMRDLFSFLELEPFDIGRPPRKNVLRYPRISPAVEESLRDLYRPHNRALTELLGQSFSWTS